MATKTATKRVPANGIPAPTAEVTILTGKEGFRYTVKDGFRSTWFRDRDSLQKALKHRFPDHRVVEERPEV